MQLRPILDDAKYSKNASTSSGRVMLAPTFSICGSGKAEKGKGCERPHLIEHLPAVSSTRVAGVLWVP